jgi:hypothetical protein
MIKVGREERLVKLLADKLAIPINPKNTVLGYHSRNLLDVEIVAKAANYFINRLSEQELIVARQEVRLGKYLIQRRGDYWHKTYFSFDDWLTIKIHYNSLKCLAAVPPMTFPEELIVAIEHKEAVPLLYADQITKDHKKQFISFMKEMNEAGVAHRDLHAENVLINEKELFVIDWDFIAENKCSLLDCYDLTGKGLPSPLRTNNHTIFKPFPLVGVPSIAELLGITLADFTD